MGPLRCGVGVCALGTGTAGSVGLNGNRRRGACAEERFRPVALAQMERLPVRTPGRGMASGVDGPLLGHRWHPWLNRTATDSQINAA